MKRIKLVLPIAAVLTLLFSLFFVNGSIAQPLGGELLQRFGVGSDGSDGGGSAAAPFFFGVPVTVVNPTSSSVPVTVQNSSNAPVNTQDVNDPSAHPYQQQVDFDFVELYAQTTPVDIVVPANQRLIIRYVSGRARVLTGQTVWVNVSSTLGGVTTLNNVPPTFAAANDASTDMIQFGLQTWIEADPGTTVTIQAVRNATSNGGLTTLDGFITISGYLVDVDTP